MPKIMSCPKCEFETPDPLVTCPKCGRTLQSAQKVRVLGWLLVVLGAFLVIFMGGLGIIIAGIIAGSGQPGNTSRFTGGPEAVLLIAVVFSLVIAFGFASIASGAWQIWFGKPNRKVMVIMFLLAGVLLVIANAIRFLM